MYFNISISINSDVFNRKSIKNLEENVSKNETHYYFEKYEYLNLTPNKVDLSLNLISNRPRSFHMKIILKLSGQICSKSLAKLWDYYHKRIL